MLKCEQTYISAQYCTTSWCNNDIQEGKLYRVEYSDVINHGLCSVTYLCRC